MTAQQYNIPVAGAAASDGAKINSGWSPTVGSVPLAAGAPQTTDADSINGGVKSAPLVTQAAASKLAIAAGAGGANVVVKAAAGYLGTIVVTSAASAVLTIYDNASTNSGDVVAIIKATAVAGDIYAVNMPCLAGITARQASGSPAVTLSYS